MFTAHRAAGLWAVDLIHGGGIGTALTFLERSSADVVLLQELRVLTAGVMAMVGAVRHLGWRLTIEPARATLSSTIAGVGIAVRPHLGAAAPRMLEHPSLLRGLRCNG